MAEAVDRPKGWRSLRSRFREWVIAVNTPDEDRVGPSIDDFYLANEERRVSKERKVGDQWFDCDGRRYEVFWVEATSELYALYLGTIALSPDFYGGPSTPERPKGWLPSVRLIAVVPEYGEVLFRLLATGDRSDTIEWIEERLAMPLAETYSRWMEKWRALERSRTPASSQSHVKIIETDSGAAIPNDGL